VVPIGASAGGVEALSYLVGQLPPDVPASVFVVVHVPSNAHSMLPRILSRAGRLPAVHAEDNMVIEAGKIYVAPPDHRMLLLPDHIRVDRGPRDSGYRPSIDRLFRSAARAYGRKVIAVVLTGNLADGTAGMRAVRRFGGVGIVQDPAEALHPGMPLSAMKHVEKECVLSLPDIAPAIVRLVNEPLAEPEVSTRELELPR